MLPDIPRAKTGDAVHPGNIENIHKEIQVRVFRNVTQHTLWSKDILIIDLLIHTYPNIPGAKTSCPSCSSLQIHVTQATQVTQVTQMTQIDRASLSANEERDQLASFPPPAFDMTLLAKDTGNLKDNIPRLQASGRPQRPYGATPVHG